MNKQMQTASAGVLGHEGPTLLNMRLDHQLFEIGVNSPGLLFTSLEIRTSLHLQDGCDYAAHRKFVDGFEVTAFCGHSPPEKVHTTVAGSNLAPYVSVGIGRPSMYMSQLEFKTLQEETFTELCERTLNPLGHTDYFVAIIPVFNEEASHGGHHPPPHDDSDMPMKSSDEDTGTERPKYQIEYVLDNRRDD